MTIVIALAHEDGVTIGSDRLWVAGQDVLQKDVLKWAVNPEGLSVGLSGSPYLMSFIADMAAASMDLKEFDDVPDQLCKILRQVFRDGDWPPEVKDCRLPSWNLDLILTDGVDVWEVSSALYPMKYGRGIPVAIGSGYQYAQGAMHATRYALNQHALSHIRDPRERAMITVSDGLAAAIAYDTHCGGEPWVMTLGNGKEES